MPGKIKDKRVRIDMECYKAIKEYQEKIQKITGEKISFREASRRYSKDTKKLIDFKPVQYRNKNKLFGEL